jgi:hypothetical protein
MALSPNRKLLAVARVEGAKMGLQSVVNMHEIPSGREVAMVVHDTVLNNKYLETILRRNIAFTADGKYFVTSANNNVKIWQLESNFLI